MKLTHTLPALLLAGAAVLPLPAAAQKAQQPTQRQPMQQTQQQQPSAQSQTGQQQASQQQGSSQQAQEFVSDAIAGDVAEVQMGQLAMKNGGSRDVKAYGRMLVTDHTKGRNEMTALARKMRMQVSTEPKAEAKQAYDELKKLKGAEFDRAFLQHAVEDHQKDLAKYQEFANAKQGAASQAAAKTVPVLQKHLKRAEQLSQTSASAAAR